MDEKIKMIMRQTNYTEKDIQEKLIEYNQDEVAVIRDYHGLKENQIKKGKTLNQEFYQQFRQFLLIEKNKTNHPMT